MRHPSKDEETRAKRKVTASPLFDGMIDGAAFIDAETKRVLLANRSAAAMFGFESPDEMVGLDPMNHIPEQDRARMAGIMAGYFVEGGTQKTMEVRAIARDGRELWVLGSGVRTHYEGRLAGIIFVKDITAQKAAEKALAETEEQQRQILNNANESIVVVQDGKIVFANRRTLELGAFSEEDIRGQSFMDFLCPEDREMMMKRYLKRVGGKEYPSSFQFKGIGKDGVVRWVEIRETSFAWEGKPAHLCLLNDITERKKAAEELAASERRYRLLADNVSDVIWVTDLQWKPTYFNPSVTRLLGYGVEEALAGAVRMTPSSLQVAMKAFQGALAREEQEPGSASGSPMMELEFIHKNGSAVWAETTVSFLRDSKGHPYAVLGILHDVSERRKAGEALRKSEERFRALIEDSSDVISIVDASGRILYESPSAERVIGYRIEDLVGKGLRDLLESGSVDRSDIDSALSVFETLLSKPGATASNEIRFRHKDGSWHVVEGSARNLLDDPRVGGIVMNYRDITERRRAEDDVKRSEERFRALIENASDAIVVVNADGQIVYESPASEKAVEKRVGNLFGSRLTEVIHPDDVQKVLDLFNRLMTQPGDEVGAGVRYRHRDGSWHTAEGTGRNLLKDPKVNGIVINYRDTTERTRAEEALRESEKLYRLLAENLSDVIWVISTDLRFTYISPSVERLLGHSVAEAVAMPVDKMVTPASFEIAMKVMAEEEAKERSGGSDRERSVTLELELPRKDGSTVWAEVRVSYLRDSGGRVMSYLGVTRDITERRKAEGALQASEERFRTIFERSPIGAIIYDSEGVTVGSNKACLEIFGLSEVSEMRGPTLFDDPNLSDRSKQKLRMGKSVMGEGALDLDRARGNGLYNNARSGLVHLKLTVTPLGANKKGSPSGYLALVEDITERKKAEESLRASEERFRGLVETTSDWVWELDRKGAYTYASPKVSGVLGYKSEELLGKTPYDFMTQREARRVAAICYPFVSRQEPFAFLEKVCRHKDGHPVILETSGVPFLASDGTLLGYRGIDRDITERKRVAKQLEQSLRKLERTMEATIQAISTTIETRDPYTAGHQRRVTQLAGVIATQMNLPSAQIAGIRVAGLLHDIGKISVPTEILSKPGLLTDVEMSMIRAHPRVGYDILKNIEFERPVARIVVQHHERLDGSGYPSGLRGEKILLEARILAVADVVEAMSSHRPYRPAVGTERALEEIARGEGTLYDPGVVRACLEAFTKNGFKFED